jgi:hypothetical protein
MEGVIEGVIKGDIGDVFNLCDGDGNGFRNLFGVYVLLLDNEEEDSEEVDGTELEFLFIGGNLGGVLCLTSI